jgi:hypothetical protein
MANNLVVRTVHYLPESGYHPFGTPRGLGVKMIFSTKIQSTNTTEGGGLNRLHLEGTILLAILANPTAVLAWPPAAFLGALAILRTSGSALRLGPLYSHSTL